MTVKRRLQSRKAPSKWKHKERCWEDQKGMFPRPVGQEKSGGIGIAQRGLWDHPQERNPGFVEGEVKISMEPWSSREATWKRENTHVQSAEKALTGART